MTRYPAWKKHQIRDSWKSLISIFLTITLLFAVFNGLSKGFWLKDKIKSGKWDGRGPIALIIEGKSPAVFVYQKDSKRLVSLALDADASYETGREEKPFVKLSARNDAGDSLVSSVSKILGANITSYATLKNKIVVDELKSQNLFKKFASIWTPLLLLTVGVRDDIQETNITRYDAFKLWWQLKTLGTKDIAFKDLSGFSEEIIALDGQKVLGADSESLNKEVGKYLEDFQLVSENYDISIENQSGKTQAAKLATNFIKSVGFL